MGISAWRSLHGPLSEGACMGGGISVEMSAGNMPIVKFIHIAKGV